MSDTPAVDIDDDNDEPEMYVVDSEEYQKTKKLQSIHDSKQEFKRLWNNRHEFDKKISESYEITDPDERKRVYFDKLAQALIMYGSELYPLIEDSLDTGLLVENDLIVDGLGESVLDGIDNSFRRHNNTKRGYEPYHIEEQVQVFRHLERLQRKLGLGLEIREETQPAEI